MGFSDDCKYDKTGIKTIQGTSYVIVLVCLFFSAQQNKST